MFKSTSASHTLPPAALQAGKLSFRNPAPSLFSGTSVSKARALSSTGTALGGRPSIGAIPKRIESLATQAVDEKGSQSAR